MILVVPIAVGLFVASFKWTERLPWLLGFSLALPITSVVNVAGQSIAAYQVFSLLTVATAGWVWTRRGERPPLAWPASAALVVFVAWSSYVTVAGPTLFDGVPVLSARGGIDQQVVDPSPLAFTISNFAQAIYLILSAVVVCYFATRKRLSPHLLAPGLALAMVISNWRLAHDKLGLFYPVSLIDNSGNFKYIDVTNTGGYRLRGVFPEPSGLALYSLAAIALSAALLPHTRRWQRVFYLGVIASAFLNLAFAASGTALVGGLLVFGVAALVAIARALRFGVSVMPLAIVGSFGIAVFLFFSQHVVHYVSSQISDKISSTSYASRTGADVFSLKLTAKVFGFGVGLGSNRPSSFWPMLLSCTGLIGTVSFLVLALVLLRRSALAPSGRATFWVLLTVIASKSVAGSNLSEPLLMLGLGMAAWSAVHPEAPFAPPDDADPEQDGRSEEPETTGDAGPAATQRTPAVAFRSGR